MNPLVLKVCTKKERFATNTLKLVATVWREDKQKFLAAYSKLI